MRGSAEGRAYDLAAGVLCVVAIGIATWIGSLHEIGNFGVESDFYGLYANQAENLRENPYHPPGYPLLMALLSLATDDLFVAGKFISALSLGLIGWVSYALLRRLFSAPIALVSATLALIALIPHSFLASTDLLGAALVVVSLQLLLGGVELSSRRVFLCGLAAGAAYMVRYQAIFLLLAIPPLLLMLDPDEAPWRRRLARAGLIVGGWLLITAPWLLYNRSFQGNVYSSAAYLQVAAHFFHETEDRLWPGTESMGKQFDSLGDVLLHDPPKLMRRYLRDATLNTPARLTREVVRFPAYLFAGAGLLFLLGDLSRRRSMYLLTTLAGYLMLGLFGYFQRYYLFVFPVLFLFVAACLFHESIRQPRRGKPWLGPHVSWILAIALSLLLAEKMFYKTRHDLAQDPTYLIELANDLREHASPGDLVISRKPHLPYLAGLKQDWIAAEDAGDFLAQARELGARYIVYSDEQARWMPSLKALADPAALPDDFQMVLRHAPSGTLVYEISPG